MNHVVAVVVVFFLNQTRVASIFPLEYYFYVFRLSHREIQRSSYNFKAAISVTGFAPWTPHKTLQFKMAEKVH